MSTSIADSPAVIILEKFLRDATMRDATRIRFERKSKNEPVFETVLQDGVEQTTVSLRQGPWGRKDSFQVQMEIDGEYETVGMLPVVLWEHIISRLKVMSRMIDYGPNKSVNGRFCLSVEGSRTENFFVTSNPNPFSDRIVIVEREAHDSH
jgi:hypothetical protein